MRLKKSSIAVLAALTMVIAGCSHGLGGRMSGDGTAASTVTFSVTDIPPEYNDMINQARNPATRSILPNAPFDFSSGLNFFLTGTSNSGKKIDMPVSVPNSPPYTFSVDLDPYVWDLTLTAYKGLPTDNKKALIGHCTIDLTKGNGAATFQMSIKGLTTPGTVKITGSVTDTDLICDYYEVGIYNLYSGELVTEYTDPVTTPPPPATHPSNAKQTYTTASPHSNPFTFHYGDTSVTPTPDPVVTLNAGAYEYRMVFYKGTAPNGIPIGSYSDTIVVYPANDLVKSLGEIDVLNRKPTKPENLRAYREDKSEDKDPNYYYVKLTWDPSRFETNYELKVQTSSNDGTTFSSADDKIYGFTATNPTAEDFLASSIRHDGSLAYGSNTCTIKLQLGKVYEVSLQARNYIGVSDWVERLVEGPTTSAPVTGHTYFEAAAVKHINRRRIHYDLNQGTLKLDAGAPSTPQNTFTVEYSEYDSYDGTPKPLPLLHIQPSTTTPLTGVTTLTRPSSATPPTVIEWKKWLNQNGGAEVTAAMPSPPTDIYKHENVFLKADFGFGLEGTVTITGPQDIPTNKLKITYDEEHGTTNTPILATPPGSNLYPVPKLTNSNATWITVQFNGLATPADYDNLHCTAYFASGAGLMSKVDLQATGNICKFSTDDYTPQRFTLKVMAEETATHQMRSQTYIIELH
ncbi:hypothetical protein E4N72_07100 [Treponema vincentii]|uniref:hypothetical protein n=1 Tax=Treponema vincentii TaxID=69710 RepID=UPI0020A4E0BA|nr:hypothetical protein [Treponema vincentii]UTC46344.1 hypothetical protein E4N72_07100 [Treponema vincentii]